MIWITGDLHGDFSRFSQKGIRKIKKNDYLIVCGDFGFVWDGNKQEQKMLSKLSKKRFYTLFVEGTHDNLDLLASFEEEEFGGAAVRSLNKRVKWLKRGMVYTLGEETVFAFGGGVSEDLGARVEGQNWWRGETPSKDEMVAGVSALDAVGKSVDFIVTYDAPLTLRNVFQPNNNEENVLNVYLQEVSKYCKFKKWFFGCYHSDKLVPPSYRCVFKDIVKAQ